MKALVYNGPKDVRLAEKPIPAVSDTDVLISLVFSAKKLSRSLAPAWAWFMIIC